MLIFLGRNLGAEEVKVEFNLNTYTEEGRDINLMRELLFFQMYTQYASVGEMSYTFIPDQGGKFLFEGPLSQLEQLLSIFQEKLEQGVTIEEFSQGKRAFLEELEKSGALFEKTVAEEIEWDHCLLAKAAALDSLMLVKSRFFGQKQLPLSSEHSQDSAHSNDLFYNLRLSSEDQKNIEKLVKNLADLNVFELLLKKKEMEKLGKKIDPVHPMRFIGYIHSRHDLRKRLPKIRSSHFKWKGFVGGFAERMSLEASRNNLLKYAPGFSHSSGLSLDRVEACIQRREWEGLINSLM